MSIESPAHLSDHGIRTPPVQRARDFLVIGVFDLQAAAPLAEGAAREQEVDARDERGALSGILDRAQQLLQLPDLAVRFELRGQEAGILEEPVGRAQLLRHERIVLQVERRTRPRQVVELALLLRFADPLLYEVVQHDPAPVPTSGRWQLMAGGLMDTARAGTPSHCMEGRTFRAIMAF